MCTPSGRRFFSQWKELQWPPGLHVLAASSTRMSAADQKAFSEVEPVLTEEVGEPADSSSGDTRAGSPPVSCKDHATRDTKISGKQAEDEEAQGNAKSVVEAELSSGPGTAQGDWETVGGVPGGPKRVLGAEADWLGASQQVQLPWSCLHGAKASHPLSSMKSTPASTSKSPEKERCDLEVGVEDGAEDGAGKPRCPSRHSELCPELAVRLSSKRHTPNHRIMLRALQLQC